MSKWQGLWGQNCLKTRYYGTLLCHETMTVMLIPRGDLGKTFTDWRWRRLAHQKKAEAYLAQHAQIWASYTTITWVFIQLISRSLGPNGSPGLEWVYIWRINTLALDYSWSGSYGCKTSEKWKKFLSPRILFCKADQNEFSHICVILGIPRSNSLWNSVLP